MSTDDAAQARPPADGAGRRHFSQLVVIGASAGGVEALSTLVSTLPEGFPAPIVVAQHLDPTHESHLQEILAQRSTLPVRTVVDHAALDAGVVFVVPANRHVEISDSELRLSAGGASRPRPSIDLLFSSAARVFGEGLIAVVLTGTGTDGAAGARAVKEAGGTVVIQNPETASFPAMPEALDPTTVDIVADLERMGSLLHDLLTGTYSPTAPDNGQALRAFLDELRERSGIDFSSYKLPTIMRRLQRRMAATDSPDLRTYIRYLQTHPEEYQRLISSFLIKVTEFFRDPDLFQYLQEHILPELIETARRRDRRLRLWSAGCATGEEAYSLALITAEALGPELEQFGVRIFATDLDNDAISFARRGVYPASAVANVPPDLLSRYFTDLSGAYEIKKGIRSLVVFGRHDLGERAPFPRIDLALCRNVLIYFTTDLQTRALQLFAFSLRTGGYLVLGKAETTSPLTDYFALVHPQLRIYRRHGDRVLIPPSRIRDAVPLPAARAPVPRRPPGRVTWLAHAPREQHGRAVGGRAEHYLQRLPVGVVFVDREYDIQFINAAARRLLGIHGPAIGDDFVHLAESVPSPALRAGIDAALRGRVHTAVHAVATPDLPPGEMRYLEIGCYPEKIEAESGEGEAALIIIHDVTESTSARQTLEESNRQQMARIEALQEQIRRLTEVNQQLMEANQELAMANAELRSANEEFLVGSEEAQAAAEEVETLNEELQATNEELETLNEELQATVEELNTTNDDLQARSQELQELAVTLETQRREAERERLQLQAILDGMSDAVLVLDRAGRAVLTNRVYREEFGESGVEAVTVDEAGRPLPREQNVLALATAGTPFTVQFTTRSAWGAPRHYEARGRPLGGGELQGIVVTIRDITAPSA